MFKFDHKPRIPMKLDPGFSPIILSNIAFEKAVQASGNPVEVKISIERSGNQI